MVASSKHQKKANLGEDRPEEIKPEESTHGFADSQSFQFEGDDMVTRVAEYRFALAQFQRISDAVIAPFDIGTRQYEALLVIHNHPEERGIIMTELADQLNITNASATGMVGRMEVKLYVERLFDLVDRRNVRVKLLADGKALLARIALADSKQIDTIRQAAREFAGQDFTPQ